MSSRKTLLLQDAYFQSDLQFNKIYPYHIQKLSGRHWTPLAIARKAAAFLASEPGIRVLDIGSGVGKFCLAAAYHRPDTQFFGVEQRELLYNIATHTQESLGLENVTFINRNFTQLNFEFYDHFYVYNPSMRTWRVPRKLTIPSIIHPNSIIITTNTCINNCN